MGEDHEKNRQKRKISSVKSFGYRIYPSVYFNIVQP